MRMRFASPVFGLALLLAVSAPSAGRAAPPPARAVHRAPTIIDNDDRMNVNNLDMAVTNHGSLAYDLITGNAGLIYPKGTLKTAVFAAGPWIGAKVNGAIRVALGEYSQEFVPGPMANGTFQPDQPAFHNFSFSRSHPLSGSDLDAYLAQGGPTDATGQALLFGDATIWSVFNDANPSIHVNEGGSTAPLGLEVQQTVFAFNRSGPLGNTIFVKWRILDKGGNRLDSTYVSVWSDPDLGGATDDLVGCDTTLALGYCYNATNSDALYGSTPPAVGFTLLRGPVVARAPGVHDTLGMTSFVRYVNGTDPGSPFETYAYMLGRNRSGSPMHVLDDPLLPATVYAVSGLSPGGASTATNWLDSNPGDRRMMITSGPFTMLPGDSQEILFAIEIGQGSNRIASIAALQAQTRALLAMLTPPIRSADVTLEPRAIQLASHAPWLTAYIEPIGFDVASIDPASVLLAGSVHADPKFATIGDHDSDGILDLMLKFRRESVDPLLTPGSVRLELSGTLITGERFAGADTVRVLAEPQQLAASVAPNPLNPGGTLRFTTEKAGLVSARLYDTSGRLVRPLLSRRAYPAGAHEISIEATGASGRPLPSGIYWIRIDTDEGAARVRLVVLK